MQSKAMTTVIHLESFTGYNCEIFRNAMNIYDTCMADNNISPPCDHVDGRHCSHINIYEGFKHFIASK